MFTDPIFSEGFVKRHQIDTKAVGSELPDPSSILEDVEDYINYDLSREGSDYVPSSEDEDVNDENIESGKVNSSPKAASKKVVKTEEIDEENDTKGQEISKEILESSILHKTNNEKISLYNFPSLTSKK